MTDRFNTFDDDIELDLCIEEKSKEVSLEESLSTLNLEEKNTPSKAKNNKKRSIGDSEIFTSRKRHKKEDKNYKKKVNKEISSEINELYYV